MLQDMENLNMENMEEMSDTQAVSGAGVETVTDDMTAIEQGETEGRKFTQKEVDDIVRRRLERERKKYESLYSDGEDFKNELIEWEKALTRREYKASAVVRLQNAGLPVEAAELLNYDNHDAFEDSYRKLVDILKTITNDAVRDVFKANGRVVQKGELRTGNDAKLREAFRP